MTLKVNGELFEYSGVPQLAALIEARGFKPERVLASVNGRVLEVGTYGAASLNDGDEVELFSFVCGG